MITKQELIDIMKEGWQPTGYYSVNFNANMVADKILERIKKELEILEILKSKIGLNYIPIQIDIKQEKYILTGVEITKEEYELLRGWLNNEN